MRHVSIPHRYCKNKIAILGQTKLKYVSIPHRYCKNEKQKKPTGQVVLFQFLIGTVKTSFICCHPCFFIHVSIPHRYCKNFETLKGTIGAGFSFNSS